MEKYEWLNKGKSCAQQYLSNENLHSFWDGIGGSWDSEMEATIANLFSTYSETIAPLLPETIKDDNDKWFILDIVVDWIRKIRHTGKSGRSEFLKYLADKSDEMHVTAIEMAFLSGKIKPEEYWGS